MSNHLDWFSVWQGRKLLVPLWSYWDSSWWMRNTKPGVELVQSGTKYTEDLGFPSEFAKKVSDAEISEEASSD